MKLWGEIGSDVEILFGQFLKLITIIQDKNSLFQYQNILADLTDKLPSLSAPSQQLASTLHHK